MGPGLVTGKGCPAALKFGWSGPEMLDERLKLRSRDPVVGRPDLGLLHQAGGGPVGRGTTAVELTCREGQLRTRQWLMYAPDIIARVPDVGGRPGPVVAAESS